MASIKNFQVKAVKTFQGHEGEPLRQGNLYFMNKKVGFVSDGDWGGEPVIRFENDVRKEWERAAAAYLAEHPEEKLWSAQEFLFYSLMDLTMDEIEFKKAVKKGYKVLTIIKMLETYIAKGIEDTRLSGLNYVLQSESVQSAVDYAKKHYGKKQFVLTHYASLEDFIIS